MKTTNARRKFRVSLWLFVFAIVLWFVILVRLQSSADINKKERTSVAASPRQIPAPRRILYVHIGKTGGEWIKAQLQVSCNTRKNPQVKKSCLQKFQRASSSLISQQTVGYLHVHTLYPRNAIPLATHYLFSVRHPLSRLKSWYIYNHPSSCDLRESNSPSCKKSEWKRQFFDCFPTLEDLGRKILSKSQDVCYDVLWNGWKGHVDNVKEPNHLYWNYQFYWNETVLKTPKINRPILVVRQESLQQDFVDLEGYFGGAVTKLFPADSKHYLTGTMTSAISTQAAQNLCCALQDEIGLYRELIRRAENLDPTSKEQTLDQAFQTCGLSSDEQMAFPFSCKTLSSWYPDGGCFSLTVDPSTTQHTLQNHNGSVGGYENMLFE